MTNPGPKSTEDLIKESRLRQQERALEIIRLQKEKEAKAAYSEQAQVNAKQSIRAAQNEQHYVEDEDRDKNDKTIANGQRGRIDANKTKQPGGYSNRYKTSGGAQPPLNIRQEEIEKRRKEEEKKDPKKRFAEEIRRLKQRAVQSAQTIARVASQASKMIVRGLAQAGGSFLAATGASVGCSGCLTLIVMLIIVVIIAYVNQTCNDNSISSAICEGAEWIANQF